MTAIMKKKSVAGKSGVAKKYELNGGEYVSEVLLREAASCLKKRYGCEGFGLREALGCLWGNISGWENIEKRAPWQPDTEVMVERILDKLVEFGWIAVDGKNYAVLV